MEAHRLFDLLSLQVQKNPNAPFLTAKQFIINKNDWKTYSFEEIQQLVNQFSEFLIQSGFKKDDKIALISENRVEWNVIDLGALQIGVVVVPMYPNISAKDYEFIFNDAEIKIAITGNSDIYEKVKSIHEKVPSLQNIYCLEAIPEKPAFLQKLPQIADIEQINNIKNQILEDDLATIIYTSGTTGNPKGVMLTHKNIVSNVLSVKQITPFYAGKRTLSFLPLCHSFERMVFYAYLSFGMHIHYAESLETIADNLKEVKPFCFTTVPRLLEKVYEKIISKGNELSGFKKILFDWSLKLGSRYKLGEKQSFFYEIQLKIARKLIFKKWHEALGGELEFIVTGAAAIQPRLITIFSAAGINIIEGYGLTETSPVLCMNRMDEKERCIGTVGLPIPNISIKLADDGEILAKGDNIMKGYYKRPDLTAEVIDSNAWFHTGDIGQWITKNGLQFLKITDRKKELFKTAGGKYIAPQVIENQMKESEFIEQMMVVGGDDKKFIAALIVPSFIQLESWAKQQGIPFSSKADLLKNAKIIQLFEQEIERFNTLFGHWEQVKKFELIADEWTVVTGELTPTMKLKRKIIENKYEKNINQLFF